MAARSVSKPKDARKSTKPLPKNLNDMSSEEFSDWLFKKLERDEDLIPSDFSEQVDRRFQADRARRAGLLFLSKPWKEMTDSVTNDRDVAVAFASVAVCLDDSIAAYKGLADLLVTAQTRINLCLCNRADMKDVMAEAKAEVKEDA